MKTVVSKTLADQYRKWLLLSLPSSKHNTKQHNVKHKVVLQVIHVTKLQKIHTGPLILCVCLCVCHMAIDHKLFQNSILPMNSTFERFHCNRRCRRHTIRQAGQLPLVYYSKLPCTCDMPLAFQINRKLWLSQLLPWPRGTSKISSCSSEMMSVWDSCPVISSRRSAELLVLILLVSLIPSASSYVLQNALILLINIPLVVNTIHLKWSVNFNVY